MANNVTQFNPDSEQQPQIDPAMHAKMLELQGASPAGMTQFNPDLQTPTGESLAGLQSPDQEPEDQSQNGTSGGVDSRPPIDEISAKAHEAVSHLVNGSFEAADNALNELLSLHVPELSAPNQFRTSVTPEEAEAGKTGSTPQDLLSQHSAAVTQAATYLKQRGEDLLGPNGQLTMLKEAAESAARHARNVQAYVMHGKTPDEVDVLQKAAMSDDPRVRANANRQLKESQERALDPGDPSRIWNNLDSYHQGVFLMGNAMSQLGMALMHVNGATPMDQLNRLMEMDFQRQKIQFEGKHMALREAYDAYSFAAKQTEDVVAREAIAKNAMLEPLRLQAEAAGDAVTAQQITNQQKQLMNAVQVQEFQLRHEKAQSALRGAYMQMSMMMPYLRSQTTPIPEQERKQLDAQLDTVNTLNEAHRRLKATGIVPASMTPYTNDADALAVHLAANETGTASPSKEAIDAQRDVIVPPALGSKSGTLDTVARESARHILQLRQRASELGSTFKADKGEVAAFVAKVDEALKNAPPEVQAAYMELTGQGGAARTAKRKTEKELDLLRK